MTSYIQFRNKLIAFIFLVMPLLFTYSLNYAQTITTSPGNWTTGANWSSGEPTNSEVANINHAMTLNTDIDIRDGGNYIISNTSPNNGSITDPSGGGDYDIEIRGTGQIDIGGTVRIGGNFTARNFGTIIVRSGDTLFVDGDFELRNDAALIVESGGVIIVEGDFETRNDAQLDVDGLIAVTGDFESRNNSAVTGTGNLQVGGTITTNNGSTVFGSSGDCDPGPCEEGSGAGLPVKLISLKAQAITSENLLVEWETLSEVNNEYFSLLISTDGKSFTEVKQIPGSGNSARRLVYQTSIAIPEADYVYLQIMQTDYDGKFQKFNPIVISTKNQSGPKASFSAYPNPGTGEQISLSFKNAFPGNYQLNIRSINGQTLHQESLAISDQFDLQNFIVYPQLSLKAGIYQISITGPSETYSTRYLVQP